MSSVERLMLLRKVPAFRTVPVDAMRALAGSCEVVSFDPGGRIFREGETGEHLYVITRGTVSIWQPGDGGATMEIARLRDGQYFGEMALFDGGPRSASATAVDATELLALGRTPFIALGTKEPQLLLEVIRSLSKSLRREMDRSRGKR